MTKPITADDVKRLREAAGVDQPTFGKALGVSPRTVRGWETGAIIPDTAQLLLTGVDAAFNGGKTLTQWGAEIRARVMTGAKR